MDKFQKTLMPIVTSLIQPITALSVHRGFISSKESVPRLMIHAKVLTYNLEFVSNVIQDIRSTGRINVSKRSPNRAIIPFVLNGRILYVQNVQEAQSLISLECVSYWIQIASFTRSRVEFVLHAMMDTAYRIASVSKPHLNLLVIQTVILSTQTENAQNVQMDTTSVLRKYAPKFKTAASSSIQSHRNVCNATQDTNSTQLINALKAFKK